MQRTPLAARMRPRSLDEVVGQSAALAADGPLRRALAAGRPPSLLLWGPPGCGKTTIARLLAEASGLPLRAISAVTGGMKELKEATAPQAGALFGPQAPPLLFVDEIHRWNKAQQDALLPLVEEGAVVLVGATTENPAFEVISALRSRTWLLRLEPLDEAALATLVRRALRDRERGLGALQLEITDEALAVLCGLGGGDARRTLGVLERAAHAVAPGGSIDIGLLSAVSGGRDLQHDKAGDAHYDVISAFIKSMRGSDPDATVYYLARLLEAGEDPAFVARRIVIAAAEDVGLAEPRALEVAVAASRAAEQVGMPEARIPLAEAALFVALAPKSNSAYLAINAAITLVKQTGAAPVPPHLRSAPTAVDRALGHGVGYRYPHDHPDGFLAQDYLPEPLLGARLYEARRHGAEKVMEERQRWWRSRATRS